MTNNKDSGGAFVMPTDRTVQVPVSLIKQAEQFDRRGGLGFEVHEWLRELRALLPQMTPTAEPPRIEDMAPGTTFTARCMGWRDDVQERFMLTAVGVVCECGSEWKVGEIDPSTIRDVTPPTEGTK